MMTLHGFIPVLTHRFPLDALLTPYVERYAPAALISAANAYPDVIEAVIVGNEVLLRKEATEEQLVALIERVRAAVAQPVTYADVWEFWIKHPRMAPAVDFLTIHLLPYWEDEPTGIDAALTQVANVRRAFGSAYAPKDILIGETG
ncbi:MAG: hypothetical protein ACK44A_13305, partial [Roseateles sp.]